MLKISAVVMASGYSARMNSNKLFLTYKGLPFLEHVINLTQALPFYERILVIKPEDSNKLTLPTNVKCLLNNEASAGQSKSVQLGTKAASGEGYLYLTVDQPLIDSELLLELFPHYSKDSIVYPKNLENQPSSPIFFGNQFRQELMAVTGKTGGREVKARHPEAWKAVSVKHPEYLTDIDTIEEYQKLIKRSDFSERGHLS